MLEALPYRKDDLTSSYRREVRARCATSTATPSAGSTCAAPAPRRVTPPTSTRRVEQHDLAEVIDWLAEQAWCDGDVGMYGTSYCGFNSLQMACERPPALKAVVAIYAHRRPVHRRRALRAARCGWSTWSTTATT